jgi:hypothetical protein
MRCGVGRKVIVCSAVLNVNVLQIRRLRWVSRATVRSDVIPLYNVCRLLAERSARISLRENYCVNVPEQSWSLLPTVAVPVVQLLLEFWGAVKLWGLYRAFRKEKNSLSTPTLSAYWLCDAPTGLTFNN